MKRTDMIAKNNPKNREGTSGEVVWLEDLFCVKGREFWDAGTSIALMSASVVLFVCVECICFGTGIVNMLGNPGVGVVVHIQSLSPRRAKL